jgi:hypothetical protein
MGKESKAVVVVGEREKLEPFRRCTLKYVW